MDPGNFASVVQWVLQHGYPLLFVLMLIEGPALTAAGAFAAAIGYFNLWTVFFLSVLANLIPDILYYAIGFWGRRTLLEKYGHYFGLTKARLKSAEELATKHSGTSLIAIKTIPLLATPGLIIVGASRMDIRKYIFWSIAITVPSSLLYLILGYYFGAAYDAVQQYLNIGGYVVILGIVIVYIVVYLQRKYARRIIEKYKKK
jgi:membrane protein DedA with SNARE-associated domain